ncbi:hypothetical protein [Antribacter gilvus]|uniref:hypothetical protein n=1 Tax=Antribacter gilvus TaxID=2304675 RepID=UPI000F7959B2|nr:hypothetical protein [Antribacter gilvus]
MGTFDWHTDIHQLEPLRGPAGLAATGLFVRAGSWTSQAGRTAFATDEALVELCGDVSKMSADIDLLVEAGLWEPCDGGYRMLRGPHNDPDLPLPLWRYSDDDLGGRLFAVDDTPDN